MLNELLHTLLTSHGTYLKKRVNHLGVPGYGLYTGNMILLRFYRDNQVRANLKLLKKDRKGRYTVNLNRVKSLHGNSKLKKLYRANSTRKLQRVPDHV